jgi:hypothetical protein
MSSNRTSSLDAPWVGAVQVFLFLLFAERATDALLSFYSGDALTTTYRHYVDLVLCAAAGGGASMLLLRRDPAKKAAKGGDEPHDARASPGSERRTGDRSNVQRINGRLCSQRSVEEILIFTDLNLDAFDYVNIITAVYRIAKITSQSIGGGRATEVLEDRRFGKLLDRLSSWLENLDLTEPCKFRARGIANAAWSLAKLGIGPTDRVDITLSLAKVGAVDVAHAGKPQEVANTVWGLSTIALKADGNQQAQPQLFAALDLESRVVFTNTFEEVARCVGHRLEDFGGQELSNTVWAYSRALQGSSYLKHERCSVVSEFMRQLAAATERRAPEFEPQQIANAAWAFTKADVLSGDELMRLFEALAAVAPPALPRLKPQELSNLVWALTRSGIQAPDLYDAIAARCVQDGFSKFKSQDFANTAWAFAGTAKRQMVNSDFWDCLLRNASGSLHLFRPLELSSLLWSLARSGYGESHLDCAKSISQLVLQNDLRFQTTQALANLAWGSARLGLTGLVPAVLAEAVRRDLRVPEISSIVWAVGKIVQYPDQNQLVALVEKANLMDAKPTELASLCWGLAKSRAFYTPAFEAASDLLKSAQPGDLGTATMAQLTWACAEAGMRPKFPMGAVEDWPNRSLSDESNM